MCQRDFLHHRLLRIGGMNTLREQFRRAFSPVVNVDHQTARNGLHEHIDKPIVSRLERKRYHTCIVGGRYLQLAGEQGGERLSK
jgi:hypothetical protein